MPAYWSSGASLDKAFLAIHSKAVSTFDASFALVSKWGMLPLLLHHCFAFFSCTCVPLTQVSLP